MTRKVITSISKSQKYTSSALSWYYFVSMLDFKIVFQILNTRFWIPLWIKPRTSTVKSHFQSRGQLF